MTYNLGSTVQITANTDQLTRGINNAELSVAELAGPAHPIQCEETGKLLARANAQGVYLFCKNCHCEHFYPWEALQKRGDKVTSERC